MNETGWQWAHGTFDSDLREDNMRLRSVLGHCPRCIAVLDEDGKLVGYNREFNALFQTPPRLGDPVSALMDEGPRAMLRQIVALAGTQQKAGAILTLHSALGSEHTARTEEDRDIEFLVATLPGDGARSVGVVMAADDRTAHVKEEAEHLGLTRDIGVANCCEAMVLAQAALCHDISNVMTTASLCVGALQEFELAVDPQVRTIIKELGEAVSHAIGIVKRTKNVYRARAASTECVDARTCIEKAMRVVAPLTRRSQILMSFKAKDEAFVPLTATELIQVLTNLLTNSIHGIEDARRAGNIQITLEHIESNHVSICVRDDGMGIEPALLQSSFEEFHTTRAAKGGTGLGLAISRTIIEDAGGRIAVLSTPGKSTEMRIELPLVTQNERASQLSAGAWRA